MELNEDRFLEELLALRRDSSPWETIPTAAEINGLFSTTSWPLPLDGLDSTSAPTPPSILPYDSFTDFYVQSSNPLTPPPLHSLPSDPTFSAPAPTQAQAQAQHDGPVQYRSILGAEPEPEVLDHFNGPCKAEPTASEEMPAATSSFTIGLFMGRSNASPGSSINTNNNNNNNNNNKSKVKRVEGQPSKNLMAERRRRKRLNDRLSMLRSVVPKISKMDRTSILGDTIDYMKELLERINNLQEEIDVGSNQVNVMSIFKDVKPNDVLVRNSPKFEVERRNLDTRVEIWCSGKPGLLLSTVTTLEALGLEIQQCVISCFNDFSVQASCSEELEQRTVFCPEDIKQALFRNAGYGGRCL